MWLEIKSKILHPQRQKYHLKATKKSEDVYKLVILMKIRLNDSNKMFLQESFSACKECKILVILAI